jgi:hypothetical protein
VVSTTASPAPNVRRYGSRSWISVGKTWPSLARTVRLSIGFLRSAGRDRIEDERERDVGGFGDAGALEGGEYVGRRWQNRNKGEIRYPGAFGERDGTAAAAPNRPKRCCRTGNGPF